ncbi:MAG TPA: hypothetical protein VFQ01_04900 [Nocardioides sp.]|nr:hypothetical protein [Nocardioides sp.]
MSELGHHEHDADRLDLGGVPDGEEVSEADAEERIDEEPDEQQNRRDPVWDEESHED